MSSVSAIGFSVPGAEARRLLCEDGSELSYWALGSGPRVLVCVNAHGQDLLVFARLSRLLASRWRVLAWKPRGTFEDGTRPMRLTDQVRDLARILAHEQVTECALVTWCAGAKVAMEYIRRHSGVRALVMTNGTYARVRGLESYETQFEQTLRELCLAVVHTPSLAPMMKTSMGALLGGGRRVSPEVEASAGTTDAALQALIAEPFQTTDSTLRYAAQVVDYLSFDISASLAEVRVPTLVLSGEADRVSSPHMAQLVSERMPQAWFTKLAAGTHYCLYEKPEESARAIEDFLVARYAQSLRQEVAP